MRFLILLFLCFPIVLSAQTAAKTDYRKPGAAIPPFIIEKVNGSTFDNTILKPGKPVLVMIVSPGCDHCEHMIDSVKQLNAQLVKMQVILVTEMRNKPQLKDFLTGKKLTGNAIFNNAGYDKSNLIYSIYTHQLLPQLNVYNAKHKLVKSFAGNFPMDSLKLFLPR